MSVLIGPAPNWLTNPAAFAASVRGFFANRS
jgi:hypothetical protein